jgi:lipopolysaccharide export system permease protein
MPIIYRYLTGEILKFFLILLVIVTSIFISVDYLGDLEIFVDSGVSLLRALFFVLLKVPFMTTLLLPVAFILAIVIVLSLMNKNNEIIILKSSGTSVYYLLKPVVLLGILAAILLFAVSEMVVPTTMEMANQIERNEIRKKKAVTTNNMNIWIKGNRLITHIEYYYPENMSVFGITRNFFDREFSLIKRVDAKKGVFKNGKWLLQDIMEQKLDPQTGQYLVTFVEEREEELDFLPDDLKSVIKKSVEMSFTQLYEYIKKVEAEGYDATMYRVDLYAKTAFPFICVIMSITGLGIATYGSRTRGLPLSIGCGLGAVFLYWVFYSFCLSLGYGEVLWPFLAAWSANLVFLFVGALLLLNVE